MIKELSPGYGHDPEKVSIEEIGTKPGEKLYEELMTLEETRRTLELRRYFAVSPAFSSLYREIDYTYPEIVGSRVDKPYNSANEAPLTRDRLRDFLSGNRLLVKDPGEVFIPEKRYWGDEKLERQADR